MTHRQFEERVRERLGINDLNAMQRRMLGSTDRTVVLLAPTGSGKTVAFAAAVIPSLRAPGTGVQAVVLVPSRELALQVGEVMRQLAAGYKTTVLRGGARFVDETAALSVTPDIIVSTPGRLLDHVERDRLDLSGVAILVIDEYDKCLELGFEGEMKRIMRGIKARRLILTSATRLPEALPAWLGAGVPVVIEAEGAMGAPRGRMAVVEVPSQSRDKLETAADLLKSLSDGRAIVFVNHRESAERLYEGLRKAGLPVGLYHGGMDQARRELAIDKLGNGSTPILVSTDLGSRGLDIDGVESVIHYHIPPTAESWTHRNGRTARQDATGSVYVIVSEADNLPEYIDFDRSYTPSGKSANPIRAHADTLYFDAGKKDKISKGDILGFIGANSDVDGKAIGRIVVKEHSAIAAVPAGTGKRLAAKLDGLKLKGHKVRVSLI